MWRVNFLTSFKTENYTLFSLFQTYIFQLEGDGTNYPQRDVLHFNLINNVY